MKMNKQLLVMVMLLSVTQVVHAVASLTAANSSNLVVVNKSITSALRIDITLNSTSSSNQKIYIVPQSTATSVSQVTIPVSSSTNNINTLQFTFLNATATASSATYVNGGYYKDRPDYLKSAGLDMKGSASLYFDLVSLMANGTNTVAAPTYVYAYADTTYLYSQNTSYVNSAGATLTLPSRFLAVWTGLPVADTSVVPNIPLAETSSTKQPVTMFAYNSDGSIKAF